MRKLRKVATWRLLLAWAVWAALIWWAPAASLSRRRRLGCRALSRARLTAATAPGLPGTSDRPSRRSASSTPLRFSSCSTTPPTRRSRRPTAGSPSSSTLTRTRRQTPQSTLRSSSPRCVSAVLKEGAASVGGRPCRIAPPAAQQRQGSAVLKARHRLRGAAGVQSAHGRGLPAELRKVWAPRRAAGHEHEASPRSPIARTVPRPSALLPRALAG